ncbi:MAG TPA: hypothetical protein VEK80_19630 [Kribbellaceae bacterium]|nr:hypothetical protein [Kribbellaceae bacterium]
MTTVLTEAPRPAPARSGSDHAITTVYTARVTEVDGLLARVAVLLNPYDVRELHLDLDRRTLRVVVEGNGFHADRVSARLAKIIGIHEVTTTR